MSKGRKSSYPEYPLGGKRPSKPGETTKRPSRTSGGGRRKTWSTLDNKERLGFAWWQAPIYKLARLKRWAKG